MKITICKSAQSLGTCAAADIAARLRAAVQAQGGARLLVSTGASQLTTLTALVEEGVPWDKIEMFHLDEYVALPETHKASFRKYLKERFTGRVPLKQAWFVDGTRENLELLTRELRRAPVDLGLIGIGENGHIAFNDPPADFETREAYHIVTLNDTCKKQQVREGWFDTAADVPARAVSMTAYQIMQCRAIISCVPYAVKAPAVRDTLESHAVTNLVPATLLKQHPDFTLYLDGESAMLTDETKIDPLDGTLVLAHESDGRRIQA